jgi:glycosyltransferase involved in cell wall biosynthesis
VQFLIEAIAAMGEPDLFLVMAGQNQGTDYARQTMALAAEKLPGQHLQLTAPYAQIPELYQASDLFILTSLQEGFGKVYLEAMASRKPMLCHRSPNTLWIVNNPEALVDMEDSGAVQEAIRALTRRTETGLSLSDKALAMAGKNHAWVNERFSWHRLRDEYMQMYEQMTYLPS